MKMNLEQTKLVGLTMELELKTKEYKKLCKKLEDLKEKNINPNEKELLLLKKQFQKNHVEIKQIKKELESIQQKEAAKEEHYDTSNLFKNRSKSVEKITLPQKISNSKINLLKRILKKVKQILHIK